MGDRYIYVILSSTPYKIGKMIRKVTRNSYNHVSIAVDQDMTQMYSFARRYCRTPLYGGFVVESASRYYRNDTCSSVKVHRIPISQEQYDGLEKRLANMTENKNRYLYNHLSVLTGLLRRPVHLRDAYTCVEFCVEILNMVGFPVVPGKYYSIGDLVHLLHPYMVYTGPMPSPDSYDTEYYARKPVPHPIWATTKSMLALVPRFISK